MNDSSFNHLISVVTTSTSPGYGFVEDLVHAIQNLEHEESQINHISVIWEYSLDGQRYINVDYHYSSNINLQPINRTNILNSDHVITSDDVDKMMYVDDFFVWKNSFVVIPINKQSGENDDIIRVKGAIFLLSNENEMGFNIQQLALLHLLLNEKKPVTFASEKVMKALQCLYLPDVKCNRVGEKWKLVSSCLDSLSSDEKEGKGVLYASFWNAIDTKHLSAGTIFKLYEIAFSKLGLPDVGCIELSPNDSHYVSGLIREEHSIKYLDSRELQSIDESQYLTSICPDNNRWSSILFKITKDEVLKSVDVCSFFILDIVYTPFISFSFTQHVYSLTQDHINNLSKNTQIALVNKLLTDNHFHKDLRTFYEQVAQDFMVVNSARDCLIYCLDSYRKLLYVRKEEINEPSSSLKSNARIGQLPCYLPEDYCSDSAFISFLRDVTLIDKCLANEVVVYRAKTPQPIVRNALVLCIHTLQEENISGLVILINRGHYTSLNNARDYDMMLSENTSTAFHGAMYLEKFHQWNLAIKRKNYLLQKLRHEIPHCTYVIKTKMKEIVDDVNRRGYILPTVITNAMAIQLNRLQILNLSKFFAAVDYDDKRFTENAKEHDFYDIINDYKPLFDSAAASKCVEIVFTCKQRSVVRKVSDFYSLAIVNIINNAIRYCSRATRILIDLNKERISVSNVGIPILDDEKEKIFEETYRSSAAKDIDNSGMGFGLHISKRVVEAHHGTIVAESEYLAPRNIFLEHAVYLYLKSLSEEKRREYIYATAESSDIINIDRQYNNLRNSVSHMSLVGDINDFFNTNIAKIRLWLEEDKKDGGDNFIDMEESWFDHPIYKVTFKIQF